MRRADRLFQIVQILQRNRLTTARRLAERLEVSERTIYRDVADLSASGVPIEGEAGVGYALRGFDLPPMMFTRDEIEALVLGARVVETWGDSELAEAAREALAKVEAVLPRRREAAVRETMLFAPPPDYRRQQLTIDLAQVRRAIRERRKIHFAYVDASERSSRRTVRPLGLAFFGPTWVVTAWCELREDFRSFRPDRMSDFELGDEVFEIEPGKSFADLLARMGADD